MSQKNLKVTLTKSVIGAKTNQRRILATLGLKRINQSVIKPDTQEVWGMLNKIPHLVDVEELEA